MKTRTLYLIVFVLAIIIIVTLIYTRSKLLELNSLTSEATLAEVKQPEEINQSPGPVFFYKEGVTIVKPGQGKQRVVSELNKAEEIIKDQSELSSPSRSPSLTSGETDSQDTEEAAGVTRLGKYPTPEETKEMNSKGIVMY